MTDEIAEKYDVSRLKLLGGPRYNWRSQRVLRRRNPYTAQGSGDRWNRRHPSVTGDSFTNSTTYHVEFAWWLPRAIPGVNDNVVQTDRTGYQLGFGAVQCRHDVADDGGPITLLPDADGETDAQHHGKTD